jgi:LacI family transcriptional regulator
MSQPRVRLKDIAVATGYSVNTVSLALRRSRRIPQETKDLILAAAQRLDYLPNHVARSLVSKATHTVGLVLTDIMNPTLTLAARSIERRLNQRGYSVMFAATDNIIANEIKALDVLRSRQVDGILIYPTSHHQIDHIRRLRQAGYPIVLLGADRDAGMDAVAIDERRGADKAVTHLIDLGHRAIAFLDAAGPLGNSEKFEGFERALKRRGLKVDAKLVLDPGGHGVTSGYHSMPALLSGPRKPTALFCPTDNLALGALAWCRDNGVRVPEDLAVVGCDNIEAAEFADVPLTTIDYATDKVSVLAIERLLSLVADAAQPARVMLVDPDLVIRGSSGSAIGSRPRPARARKSRAG